MKVDVFVYIFAPYTLRQFKLTLLGWVRVETVAVVYVDFRYVRDNISLIKLSILGARLFRQSINIVTKCF